MRINTLFASYFDENNSPIRIKPQFFTLKDGRAAILRCAGSEEAAEVLALMRQTVHIGEYIRNTERNLAI